MADVITAPGIFGTGLEKLDVSDVLSAILLKDTALLGEIPMGENAKNIETKWVEADLNATFVTGTYVATTNVLTIIDPATTADVLRIVRQNAIVKPEGEEFALQFGVAPVTGANTMTVYGNTTDANLTTAIKFIVVGMPKEDNAAASADISKMRLIRRNFTQVFERAAQIEKSREGMEAHGVTDELKLQIEHRTLEMKSELNRAIINSLAFWTGSTFSADLQNRTMAGIVQLIRDPDLTGTATDKTVINVSGVLTEAVLNLLADTIAERGGMADDADPVIVTGSKQRRVISAFNKERMRVTENNRVAGFYITNYMTDLGKSMPIITDRHMPSDKLMVLDKKAVELKALQGDTWGMEEMGKEGRNKKFQLSGQYTVVVRNADQRHGLLINLT